MSQNITNLEAQMNSVERAQHYIDTIEQDGCGSGAPLLGYQGSGARKATAAAPSAAVADSHALITAAPAGWPKTGSIDFDNYSLKYATGEPVLRGITASIKSGEKVGVVGRTGAGKSSLMLGLFRIIEAHGGTCSIDGQDISKMPLSDLRRSISMIPQDPVLFSGTVRGNIDPFDDGGNDARLWQALDKVNLSEHIKGLEGGLDAPVAEFGE